MNDIIEVFRQLAKADVDGIVSVTEVVDAIIDESGGSREYLERKVRSTLREHGRKGLAVSLRKRIVSATGSSTLVPAWKEKRRG